MVSCCEDKSCEITNLVNKHRRVLQIVLTINVVIFLVEGVAGIFAHSTSLMADALDMFGDALVYGLSIYVITSDSRKQASASMVKGFFMLFFGIVVLGGAAYKVLNPILPDASTIGMVGTIALMANIICFFMLNTHREDNLNMSSTWLCSRNDLIAGLFLKSATHVIGQAKLEM